MIQKKLADLIKPKQLSVEPGDDPGARRHGRRRAAGARLRPDARQCAAARAVVVAAGRGRHLGPDRGRAARILVDPGRARGRHRHRPQHQRHRAADAWRGPEAHAAARHRPGRGTRRHDRDRPRHRDHEPRACDLHARQRRQDLDGTDRRDRQGLSARRPQNRPEDAPIGLIPVDALFSPVRKVQLQGREHPRRPASPTTTSCRCGSRPTAR